MFKVVAIVVLSIAVLKGVHANGNQCPTLQDLEDCQCYDDELGNTYHKRDPCRKNGGGHPNGKNKCCPCKPKLPKFGKIVDKFCEYYGMKTIYDIDVCTALTKENFFQYTNQNHNEHTDEDEVQIVSISEYDEGMGAPRGCFVENYEENGLWNNRVHQPTVCINKFFQSRERCSKNRPCFCERREEVKMMKKGNCKNMDMYDIKKDVTCMEIAKRELYKNTFTRNNYISDDRQKVNMKKIRDRKMPKGCFSVMPKDKTIKQRFPGIWEGLSGIFDNDEDEYTPTVFLNMMDDEDEDEEVEEGWDKFTEEFWGFCAETPLTYEEDD